MSDSDSIVKNEAFALPLTLGWGNFCEVFEDTALEVVDIFKALGKEVGGGFFTADTACAEKGDVVVLVRIEVGGDVCGKFGEGIGMRIDRSAESPNFDFVLIAGIDDEDIGIGNQFIPVLGFDVGTDEIGGVNGGDT